MHCPRLGELPSAPEGKTGWPWTKETPRLPEARINNSRWPRISIVTPSYNQGQFIEETIRSVLLQGYPNLEYFVIDGGSTDNSVEIIKKYERWLTYWVSEPDKGQANAINKGLERATGEIAAYLNSDDLYLSGALQHVAQVYDKMHFNILVGRRKTAKPKYFLLRRNWWKTQMQPFVYPFIFSNKSRYELPQECVFWDHMKYRGMRFNEHFHFCLDVWWFGQIFSGASVVHSTRRVGIFRIHPETKSFRIPELARTEIFEIRSQMSPYTRAISDQTKKQIVSSYQNESRRVLFSQLLMPWKEYFFQYQHPAYLQHESTKG